MDGSIADHKAATSTHFACKAYQPVGTFSYAERAGSLIVTEKNAKTKVLGGRFVCDPGQGLRSHNGRAISAPRPASRRAPSSIIFKSKEELGLAAVNYWSEITGAFFAAAPYHQHADTLERVLGYIDFRKSMLVGSVPEFTCLAGTMFPGTW